MNEAANDGMSNQKRRKQKKLEMKQMNEELRAMHRDGKVSESL